jgi:hypothetical protein
VGARIEPSGTLDELKGNRPCDCLVASPSVGRAIRFGRDERGPAFTNDGGENLFGAAGADHQATAAPAERCVQRAERREEERVAALTAGRTSEQGRIENEERHEFAGTGERGGQCLVVVETEVASDPPNDGCHRCVLYLSGG